MRIITILTILTSYDRICNTKFSFIENFYFGGNMRFQIFKLFFEIFVICIISAFSFPYWKNINASTINLDDSIAGLEPGLEIYSVNKSEASIITEDSNFKTSNFIVYNRSNTQKGGKILLKYAKLSTLDYQNLLILINDKSFDLSSLYLTENRDYYVFKIENISLKKFANYEYDIDYKVKEGVVYDQILGKYFDANIEITEY